MEDLRKMARAIDELFAGYKQVTFRWCEECGDHVPEAALVLHALLHEASLLRIPQQLLDPSAPQGARLREICEAHRVRVDAGSDGVCVTAELAILAARETRCARFSHNPYGSTPSSPT